MLTPQLWSRSVFQLGLAGHPCAVSTTVNGFALLHTVPDDAASAMRANWGELMDSTLEAVESVRQSILNDLERLVVLVPTGLALGHIRTSP